MSRYEKYDNVKQSIQKILALKRLGTKNRYIAKRFDVSERFIGDLLKSVGRTREGWDQKIVLDSLPGSCYGACEREVL